MSFLQPLLRLCLLLVVGTLVLLLQAQTLAQRPGLPGAREPIPAKHVDEEQGRRIIESFRNQRLAGDFYFRFELVQIPRRGKETVYIGEMWGTWTDEGPLTRVAVWRPRDKEQTLRQFIILSGSNPRTWRTLDDGSVEELDAAQMITPLVPGLLYTPFDLAMPFVYWDAAYLGPDRVRGRRAQLFNMTAPEAIRSQMPQWHQVEVALDDDFNALLRANIVDAGGKALRSFLIRSFKEVSDQYIVKGVDLLDEPSRDKTRFEVLAAAVGLRLPLSVFNPASLEGNRLPALEPIPVQTL